MKDWLFERSIDEWTDRNLERLDKRRYFKNLHVVKLPYGESVNNLGENVKPLTYVVKKGDTLKKITEYFDISFGELVNLLLETNSTTNLHSGMTIKIPRHFIDMTKAE